MHTVKQRLLFLLEEVQVQLEAIGRLNRVGALLLCLLRAGVQEWSPQVYRGTDGNHNVDITEGF